MPIKEGGTSRKVFTVCNYVFLFLMMIITLYPLWLQFITSISHGLEVMKGGVTLLPRSPTLETYKTIVRGELFMYMKNTVVYTVVGTVINLVMSCLCAYPLARKTFSGRKFFTMLVTFTMFFSGGMIPLYLTVKQFGMMDTIWALVLPGAISTYNMIVIRTAFQSIPDSLIESAQLDGANDLIIVFRITLPLIMPTIAVLLLYYGVGHWNAWFPASIYLQDNNKLPIQNIMRSILIANSDLLNASGSETDKVDDFAETIKYATIVLTTVPVLCIYPFLQKYFVKGVMIGAVKG